MPASDAYACVGNSVSVHRYSPAAERFIEVSISGLRAFDTRACFAGSTWESSRGLASAMIAMRTSAFSTAHWAGGEIQSSCSSEASS